MVRQPPEPRLFPYAQLSRPAREAGGVLARLEGVPADEDERRDAVVALGGGADQDPTVGVADEDERPVEAVEHTRDRKSTRLNSSHANISYAVFCLKKDRASL